MILSWDDMARILEMEEIDAPTPKKPHEIEAMLAVERYINDGDRMFGADWMLGGMARRLRMHVDAANGRADMAIYEAKGETDEIQKKISEAKQFSSEVSTLIAAGSIDFLKSIQGNGLKYILQGLGADIKNITKNLTIQYEKILSIAAGESSK